MAFIERVAGELKGSPRTLEIYRTDWKKYQDVRWKAHLISPPPPFPTVKRCLQGIKAILPKEVAVQMLVKWYNAYNAPGGPSYHSEWNLFVTCLMNMMGYNTERLSWTRNVRNLICLFS